MGGGGGGGGSDVFVWAFLKGHALIHSRKWEGYNFLGKKDSKIPQPTPTNKKRTFPKKGQHLFLAQCFFHEVSYRSLLAHA